MCANGSPLFETLTLNSLLQCLRHPTGVGVYISYLIAALYYVCIPCAGRPDHMDKQLVAWRYPTLMLHLASLKDTKGKVYSGFSWHITLHSIETSKPFKCDLDQELRR